MSDAVIAVCPPAVLAASQWDDIWNLTRRYMDTSREYLESKLRHHSQIAMFRTPEALVGIAALDVYPTRFEGRRSMIIFTSSVVIDEAWRGRALIQRLGVRTWWHTRMRNPFIPICWMFDTFSYKSYLLLARNFGEFWPRHGAPMPPRVAAFIDHLAREHYGDDWIGERGIVRRSGRKRLRPQTAPITQAMLADPNLRFFVDANPGHAEGDMLVCLCPLTVKNWAKALISSVRFLIRQWASRSLLVSLGAIPGNRAPIAGVAEIRAWPRAIAAEDVASVGIENARHQRAAVGVDGRRDQKCHRQTQSDSCAHERNPPGGGSIDSGHR